MPNAAARTDYGAELCGKDRLRGWVMRPHGFKNALKCNVQKSKTIGGEGGAGSKVRY